MHDQQEPIDFTEEHALQVLRDHINIIAKRSVDRHGPMTSMQVLEKVLQDPEIIRREVTWRFDSSLLESGEFAMAVPDGEGYVIAVHEWFKGKEEALPLLIAYHLATINYGEGVIEASEAELFAAALLAMDVDLYYEQVCNHADAFFASK